MSARRSFLVPVDGSPPAEQAVRYVIDALRNGQEADVHLLNVQPPVSGSVAHATGQGAIDAFRRDEAEKTFAGAKSLLDASAIPYQLHIGVGDPGHVILAFVERLGCSQIVMGTRGHGAALGLLLGSVASHTLQHATVPVTLVK